MNKRNLCMAMSLTLWLSAASDVGRLILEVLARERLAGRTVIMVTHDMPGARHHVVHVVLMRFWRHRQMG